MKKHELTQMKLLHAQVCSEGTWDEALEFIQCEHAAGTSNNWQKAEGEEFKPVACNDHKNRKHYAFVC